MAIDLDQGGSHSFVKWRQRSRALYRHRWVVYAKTPLGGPAQVLDYLARYTTAPPSPTSAS